MDWTHNLSLIHELPVLCSLVVLCDHPRLVRDIFKTYFGVFWNLSVSPQCTSESIRLRTPSVLL